MIDWERVLDLREEVGPEDFDEVIELFMSEVEECLDGLSSGAEPEKMEEDMHLLKGCALNLGFSQFAQLCQTGETAAAEKQAGSVDVDAVRLLFKQSQTTFATEMDAHIK